MAYPRDWIAVAALPGLGPAGIKRLWEHGWTPHRLLRAGQSELKRLGVKPQTLHALQEFQQDKGPLETALRTSEHWLQQHDDAHILALTDPDYPKLLTHLSDPPPVLFVRGNPTCLQLPQLAVVGSRHASRSGGELSRHFASCLSQHGFVITSGLAWGIDSAAHRAAVEAGNATVAVFGTGIDQVYPTRNTLLAEAILANRGAWVTELLPGAPAHASHFPRRNRIISGLSLGVLVIEAALRSGSLITARQAMDQGREVFAIPGTIHNPLSKGCHQLIREGATLVETEQDIIRQLPALLGGMESVEPQEDSVLPELSSAEQQLMLILDYTPADLDQLAELLQQPAATLIPLLVQLELKGLVEQSATGYKLAK